jgi:hypothetical protein
MLGELGDSFEAISFLQSAQSHSSAPPVDGIVGDLSLGFAPGIFRGTAGDDVRLYALLLGLWIPGVDARLNASFWALGDGVLVLTGAGVVDFNGGVSLLGVGAFVDEYPESDTAS